MQLLPLMSQSVTDKCNAANQKTTADEEDVVVNTVREH